MKVTAVEGDLLDQDVDVVVNPWNRNIIPWWLLIPQGVSGAIKKRAGLQPFRELARMGAIPLGCAVVTQAGKLPFRAIIHVAGINMFWRASASSIQDSVRNAVKAAEQLEAQRIAFPLIGSGSGGYSAIEAERLMVDVLSQMESDLEVLIVRYRRCA